MRGDRRTPTSRQVSLASQMLAATPVTAWPVYAWESASVTVTASATPHASGAWTELVASTSAAIDYLMVLISGMSVASTDTAALLDIGTGSAASEVAIASSIPAGWAFNTAPGGRQNLVHVLPLNVPAGTRIAARLQALISSDTAAVVVAGYTATPSGRTPRALDTLGAVVASSRGTNMPTNDTYVEVVATTTTPYQALVILPAAAGSTAAAGERSTYTVAVGAGGAEVALGSASISTSASETLGRNDLDLFGIVPAMIPTGSRIACKQSVGRNYRDAVILGVPVS